MLQTVSNTHTQVAAEQCMNDMRHRSAMWCVGTAQVLILTELKLYLCLLFTNWSLSLRKKARWSEYLEKAPNNELQEMPYANTKTFKAWARLPHTPALLTSVLVENWMSALVLSLQFMNQKSFFCVCVNLPLLLDDTHCVLTDWGWPIHRNRGGSHCTRRILFLQWDQLSATSCWQLLGVGV